MKDTQKHRSARKPTLSQLFRFGARNSLALAEDLFKPISKLDTKDLPASDDADRPARGQHLSLLKITENEKQRLPENFSAREQEALIQKLVADGRPILIVTDAWRGQRNGVVTVMEVLRREIQRITDGKVPVHIVTPDQYPGITVRYADLNISYAGFRGFQKLFQSLNPQAIHIATEGPLGLQARFSFSRKKIPFTTAYHTDFPEYFSKLVSSYIKGLAKPALWLGNWLLRNFHSAGSGVMVPTQSIATKLLQFGHIPSAIRYWSHGVETKTFRPDLRDSSLYEGLQKPISLFVGRIELEKNLLDFLNLDIPGSKVLIGDGTEMESLKKRYPQAHFLGRRTHQELPKYYASADIFVFPSITETFGLVQLEALACGLPVVGYKVQGPVDVITCEKVGALAAYDAKNPQRNLQNFRIAWNKAIKLSRKNCREFAEQRTWERSTMEFLYFLHRIDQPIASHRVPRTAKLCQK